MFYFHPYLGKIPILTNIFSKGLKPPSRICFILSERICQKAFLVVQSYAKPGFHVVELLIPNQLS